MLQYLSGYCGRDLSAWDLALLHLLICPYSRFVSLELGDHFHAVLIADNLPACIFHAFLLPGRTRYLCYEEWHKIHCTRVA